MKVKIEIDCTPEEARRAMGLPDAAAVQEVYAGKLAEMGAKGFQPEAVEAMVKSWSPLGEAGLGMWRALVEAAAKKPDEPR